LAQKLGPLSAQESARQLVPKSVLGQGRSSGQEPEKVQVWKLGQKLAALLAPGSAG